MTEIIAKEDILGREFTVYGSVEEPLFLAKDVAEMIEHSDVSTMLRSVDEDEKVTNIVCTLGGNQKAWFLTENGLYEVLMLSRKPIAKEFKKVIKSFLHNLRTNKVEIVPKASKEEIAIADRNSRLAEAEYWKDLADRYTGNKTYEQILIAYSTKAVAGEFVLPLPVLEEKNYSATEVGKMLSVSATKIGMIANKLGIKVDGEYGKWYVDKARNSSKEVNTFRYTQKAIDEIKACIK